MLVWSHWSRPHGPDGRAQRITQNVLRRALGMTFGGEARLRETIKELVEAHRAGVGVS